jgi:hypothetical protein
MWKDIHPETGSVLPCDEFWEHSLSLLWSCKFRYWLCLSDGAASWSRISYLRCIDVCMDRLGTCDTGSASSLHQFIDDGIKLSKQLTQISYGASWWLQIYPALHRPILQIVLCQSIHLWPDLHAVHEGIHQIHRVQPSTRRDILRRF